MTDWQVCREEHRQAAARFVAAIQGLDEVGWLRKPAPDKWCPGQIAEHLVLSYDAMLRELRGQGAMRVRPRWWRRQLLRMRVLPRILKDRRMPSGAPAVRELRPGDAPRPLATLVEHFRGRAELFDSELNQAFAAGGGRLTHPFFGRLTAPRVLRVIAVHIDHHRRQVPGAEPA